MHRRLCAWHLLRNAQSNVKKCEMMLYLKRCMLGEIEDDEFDRVWSEMVEKFGLENNNWLKEF